MTNNIFTATFVNPFTGKEQEYSYWTNISTVRRTLFVRSVVEVIVTDNFYDGLLKDMLIKRTVIAYIVRLFVVPWGPPLVRTFIRS